MRKLFRSGPIERAAPDGGTPHACAGAGVRAGLVAARRWAAGLVLGGAMAGTVLGATPSGAQSIDIFGTAPASSTASGAPATGASPAKNPMAKEMSAAPPSPAPNRDEGASAKNTRGRNRPNNPADTAPPQSGPVLHTARPNPAPAELGPVAASSAPAPAIAAPPALAPSSAPRRSVARDMLYPLGIGFGLASELGALWLILRWRARRARRAQDEGQPTSNQPAQTQPAPGRFASPILRRTPPPAAPNDEDHPSTIARLLDQAAAVEPAQAPAAAPAPAYAAAHVDLYPQAEAPIEVARNPVSPEAFAPGAAPVPVPPPAPAPAATEAPPARGVFKPSPLFNRIQPAEPAPPPPVAPPDPLSIDFAALRLSTSPSRIELRFRVTLRNEGSEAIGPIRVDSCMSTPEGDLPDTALAHSLATLMPGEEAAIAEEWRLPLAMLPTLRLGTVRLLVGAARIFATVEGASAHRFQDRTFLIGLPEEGGRLVPIPLDGGAHLYDNLLVQSIACDQG